MASMPRTIRLRRPPILAMQEGVFLPRAGGEVLDEVDRRWGAMRDANPAVFDGRVCHVLGMHRNGHGGATIHAIDCAYRFYAVQDDSFDLGVRPLGVKGMVVREGQILIGRRSRQVRVYRGLREFVPGGTVEPGSEPSSAIVKELVEETGLEPAAPPTAAAILYDEVARTWEVVHRVQPLAGEVKSSSEHDSIIWTQMDQVGDLNDLSPISRRMASLLTELARAASDGPARQPGSGAGRIVR